MRVLVVSHLYPSPARPTYGVFVHDQARALASLGCDVRVISPTLYAPPLLSRFQPRWRVLREVPRSAVREGIPVYHPRYLNVPWGLLSACSGYSCYLGVRSLAARLLSDFQPDVIHAHTALPDGFAAMLLNRRARNPLVITVHGYDAYLHLRPGGERRKRVTQALLAADRVVCVSEALRELCRAWVPEAASFQVVHNGFRVHEATTEVRPRSRGDQTTLLTVGTLIPRKAHRHVLEAVAALRDQGRRLRYRIVGEGYVRSDLERMVARLGLGDVVTFVGPVPPEALSAEYQACDLFVMPSWDESFGVVYLEAMAHGKPIVACVGEGIADIVEDGETAVLVPTRDSQAVAAAISSLMHDPERARRIGEAGRRLATQFTWRRNAEQVLAIYRELIPDA